jgi:signal transduction histidine kinase
VEAGARRLSAPPRSLAWATALAVAGVAALGAGLVRNEIRDDDRRHDAALAAVGIAATSAAVGAAVEAAEAAAAAPTVGVGLPSPIGPQQIAAVLVVERRDGTAPVVRVVAGSPGPLGRDTDLLALPEAAAALLAVQESGNPGASAPLPERWEGAVLLVHPAYGGGPGPTTVAERRRALTGWTVSVIDPARVVATGQWSDVGVTVTDAGRPVHAAGPQDGAVVSRQHIDVLGRVWTADVHGGGRAGSALPWIVLGTGAAAAAAILVAMLRLTARSRVTAIAGDRRARHLEQVAEGAGRLHQSLDLDEMLPTFATVAGGVTPLQHMAVLVDDGASMLEVFRTGPTPGHVPEPSPVPPTRLAAGEAVTIPLSRGWRTVGCVVLVPATDVGEDEMLSLRALLEVLAAALANAEVLRREKETVRRLAEVDRLKDAFLGTVSHELRTSVTAVGGFTDLLVHQWDVLSEDARRDFAARVGRNAMSLRALVDQLLDFARLERGSLRVAPVEGDLAAMARAAVDQLSVLLPSHELVVATGEPVPVMADASVVERVLSNLLSNAAKYAPATTTVTVEVRSAGDHAELAVSDQGPGIPNEERPLVFTRFYRGESDVARATRGAGIGLAVVKELVERSGGWVRVEDAEGGGARFVVRFPVPSPAAATAGERHESA